MKKTLVVGVGNTLMSDEGIGVAVSKALMRERLPAGVEVVDAGCALADMLLGLGDYAKLIIVDAVRGGGSPGDVYRFDLKVLADKGPTSPCFISLHEIGVLESIAMAEMAGEEIPPITIIGVEPLKVELGTELSRPIFLSIPGIVNAVKSEFDDGDAPEL